MTHQEVPFTLAVGEDKKGVTLESGPKEIGALISCAISHTENSMIAATRVGDDEVANWWMNRRLTLLRLEEQLKAMLKSDAGIPDPPPLS